MVAGGTVAAHAAAPGVMLWLLPLPAPRSVLPAASHRRFPKGFLINTSKLSVKAGSPAWGGSSKCCPELSKSSQPVAPGWCHAPALGVFFFSYSYVL